MWTLQILLDTISKYCREYSVINIDSIHSINKAAKQLKEIWLVLYDITCKLKYLLNKVIRIYETLHLYLLDLGIKNAIRFNIICPTVHRIYENKSHCMHVIYRSNKIQFPIKLYNIFEALFCKKRNICVYYPTSWLLLCALQRVSIKQLGVFISL